MNFRSRPDLVFRSSPRLVVGDTLVGAKERRGCNVLPLGERSANFFQSFFVEAEADDTDRTIGLNQKNCGNIG